MRPYASPEEFAKKLAHIFMVWAEDIRQQELEKAKKDTPPID